jgi:hypothetical protein
MSERIETYLAKHADLGARPLVSGSTDGLEHAVVIPVLAEDDFLFQTLDHLRANPAQDLERTLIICVVNNRCDAEPAQSAGNQNTLAKLGALVRSNELAPLRLAYIDAASPGHELPPKEGVGLARKIGMDWALNLLRAPSRRPRLILCLDADTLVEPNYLPAVRSHFDTPETWAAVVDYAHPLDRSPDEVAAMLSYELYLRYHELALRYAGSPYAYPAIGSTMVCHTEAYAASGGMNRRQGGEDFYFLQQLAKTGGVTRIYTTTVHPSARPSQRVPLGTGQRVQRFLDRTHDEYVLYNSESYRILKSWLALAHDQWDGHAKEVLAEAGEINTELRLFLRDNQFVEVWERLRKHSKTAEQMRQQVHSWFDGFRSLKLLHHLRDNGYPQQDTFVALRTVLDWLQLPVEGIAWDDLRHNTAEQQRLLERLRGFRA